MPDAGCSDRFSLAQAPSLESLAFRLFYTTARVTPLSFLHLHASMFGWLFGWGKGSAPSVSPQELERIQKKSKSVAAALERCRKANIDNPSACNNLDTSLVMSYAEELCKPEAEEHKRCYFSVINTGRYNGSLDCQESVLAMQQCLRKQKLYPFK